MKRVDVSPMTTPEYSGWWIRRANDNIPMPSLEGARSIEEYLRVVPSGLEIIKQDFEKRNSELGRRIEKLEEEKMYLRLDVDVQKSEAKKLRKGKKRVEEDLNDLKTEYKKLHLSTKNAGLGNTSEKWQHEVQEEKAKADHWEKKFLEMQMQNEALEKRLAESQKEKSGLKDRVAELGRSLHHHRSHNSVNELKSSLNKIEEMKGKIEILESALQNCELQIEQLEAREGHWKEELHHSYDQVRSRDYPMGEAIV
ncbi:paramyosin-like [Gossypium australe]|uniref:Paramyosin-like n=1 Tax=Gossypium australe TaxID=47621 RepID=A0A5B6WPC1_9ROSI|nr:paramyosin-like [Gossypium australe]